MDNSCLLSFYHFSIVYFMHYDSGNNSRNTKKYIILYIMRTIDCINNVNVISKLSYM